MLEDGSMEGFVEDGVQMASCAEKAARECPQGISRGTMVVLVIPRPTVSGSCDRMDLAINRH
jgi:hypothetical protein